MGDVRAIAIIGILVAIHAWGRFDHPPMNRASTTRGQYYSSGVAYVLCALALYVVLTSALKAQPELLTLLTAGAAEALPDEVTSLPAPLLAALIMTTLLPHVPGISRIDEWLLARFRSFGRIPGEVRRFSTELANSGYEISAELQERTSRYVLENGSIPDRLAEELRFGGADSARGLFTRNLALYVQLRELRGKPGCEAFFEQFAAEVAELDASFAEFLAQSAGFFAFSGQIAPELQTDPAHRGLAEARQTYKAQCRRMYELLCLVIARALLRSSWATAALMQRARAMGFVLSAPAQGAVWANSIAALVVTLFAFFFAAAWLLRGAVPLELARLAGVAVLVALLYGVAMTAALLPKEQWGLVANEERGRPVIGYIVSALIALGGAAAISILYQAISEWSLAAGWRAFQLRYPWIIMPTVAAFVLAAMCDDRPEAAGEHRLRVIEALGLGAAMIFCAFVVRQSLVAMAPPGTEGPPPILTLLMLSAAIGLLLGATVPHRYRQIRARRALLPP
jgi:hypothetical protein